MALPNDLAGGPADRATREPGAPLIIVLDRDGALLPRYRDNELTRLEPDDLRAIRRHLTGEQPIEAGSPAEPHLRGRGDIGAYQPALATPQPRPARPRPEGLHHLVTPIALAATAAGFDAIDHDGELMVRFDDRDVVALLSLLDPRTVEEMHAAHVEAAGELALSDAEFDSLVAELVDLGLVATVEAANLESVQGRADREVRAGLREAHRRANDVRRYLAEHIEAEQERARRTGRTRTRVVPVNSEGHPILSLGLVMAYAASIDDGRLVEEYDFVPDWSDLTVGELTPEDPPAIFLFSNYIWSHAHNVVRSEQIKAKNPRSLTIHGGPNTPKYEEDIDNFFRTNRHVDIVVHGEGEATFVELLDVLQGCFAAGEPDLTVLRDLPGITFRLGDEIIQNPKRDRITDLDTLPSPYLSGLFDQTGDAEISLMTIETNRGCPYGCTFCDWGSATLSRIRKFDLQRVFDELEWCAKHKVKMIFCADANFGIFARDVEIARKVVELKEKYGYPKTWESSYAKNTVKHLREIIEIMSEGGVLSTGTLSLQSLDQTTLDTIRRSNISVSKYEDLAVEFGNNDLALVMELMMGLPGSTVTSFLGDLQQIIDREVRARVNPTEVLMNSPMNDPEYRAEHKIEMLRPIDHDWRENFLTRKKSLIVSTDTFTRDEYALMERYRLVFLLCENFGVLRQVSRYVRQATGLTESELYVRLATDAYDPDLPLPMLRYLFDVVSEYMIPPASWTLLFEELRGYLVDQLGVPDDSALDTALRVQRALLPARDRSFPETVELAHDFGAWHRAMLVAKRSGSATTWTDEVPPLRDYPPALFEVDDPQLITTHGMGMSLFYDGESDWEFASPVARPIRFRHTIHV